MQKYYLLSLVIMSALIPLRNADIESLEDAAKKTAKEFVFFMALWGLGIRYLYWKLSP